MLKTLNDLLGPRMEVPTSDVFSLAETVVVCYSPPNLDQLQE
jgi:hypothetical protein